MAAPEVLWRHTLLDGSVAHCVLAPVGLIRSCGHFRKGDYDVHDGEDDEAPAGAPAVR